MLARDFNAQSRIGDLLAQYMAGANVLGRTHIQQEVKRKTGLVVPIATSSRHISFAEDTLSAGFGFDLPNQGAVDFLRKLTPVTKDTFDGLSSQYRKDAFTIAGTSDLRLITKIRDELADVAAKGGTPQDFDDAVKKLTSDAGVAQLNAFNLDTAFETAIHRAYSLGRYEQMTAPAVMDVLPYWQYMTVGDDRVRPEHAVLDYFVARADDPVWRKIYPPNGFNCRCIVVALLPDEAKLFPGFDDPGMERLPALAILKVPQPGFSKVFAA